MRTLRGVVHVHSCFSYDGRLELAELAERLWRRCDFAFITEHNDGLNADRLWDLRAACLSASNRMLLVPGLELRCEGDLHLLSLGALPEVPVGVPLAHAARAVRAAGGLPVWAHPPRSTRHRIGPEALLLLEGIEVWNGKRDSRWSIPAGDRAWLEEARLAGRALHAYAGLDLHRAGEERGVTVSVDAQERSREGLLEAFRQGRYSLELGPLHFDADGCTAWSSQLAATVVERRLVPWARRVRKHWTAARDSPRQT